MAVVRQPPISLVHPGIKRSLQMVRMEEKSLTSLVCDKQCLAFLLHIHERPDHLASESYSNRLEKIVNSITCLEESGKVFRTFCVMSFLNRYHSRAVIIDVLKKLDDGISNPQWTMLNLLQKECSQLLTRMSTIESLSSLDTDIICLLCALCRREPQNFSLNNLLFEIGRSVWPYINRSLWDSEPFVDFICDILEVIGGRLEQLYPKNFKTAWNVIKSNIIGVSTTLPCYSRLRLLAIIEHRHRMWSLPEEIVEFYKQQYQEFVEVKMKEVLSFLGYLPSKRKTSLTVKPGRSAADFLKRRLSSEQQEKEEHSLSSNSDSTECLSDVSEDVFESKEEPTCPTQDIKDSSRNVNSDQVNGISHCSDSTGNSELIEESPARIDTKKENMKIELSLTEEPTQSKTVGEECHPVCDTSNENIPTKESILEDRNQDTVDKENCEETSTETPSNDADHRRFFLERKTITVKVPRKYVGRVIGTHGSVIISIQDESGARVRFIRNRGVTTSVSTRPTTSVSYVKNFVHNCLGIPLRRSSTDEDTTSKEEDETTSNEDELSAKEEGKATSIPNRTLSKKDETISEEDDMSSKNGQDNTPLEQLDETPAKDEVETTSEEENKGETNEHQEKVTDEEDEEEEFEITGTDETISKAKRKIENIIKFAKNSESRIALARSLSEVTRKQGFKQIYRSLSCPITDWGEDCLGDCLSCQRGCYCRAFLLSISESESAWVRPDDLSITRDADWTELIVKTQVNNLRRFSDKGTN